ncbi:MAG: hypothetical protein QM737_00925 [Ferruginibacter sp.]
MQDYQVSKQKGISKSLFMIVLLIALGLAGFTAYHSFTPAHKNIPTDTAEKINQQPNNILDSSSVPNNKPIKKGKTKSKKTTVPAGNKFNSDLNEKPTTNEAMPVVNSNTGKKYQVVKTAYFYDEPDVKNLHNPNMAVYNGRVTAVEESKYFIYTVVLNSEGKYTKGWLLKKNLAPVD